MPENSRDVFESLIYFALVCVSALTISFIVSLIVFHLGVPAAAADYVRLNLFVTGCIAMPTALIATLHDFHSRSYQRRIEALAWTDELTGLLNRRFFLRAAEDECRRMRRTGQTAAIAMLDLDFFKEINDLFGHAAGDRVLADIAQAAHAELRGPFDKLARWGGEEFAVLLSDVSPKEAQLVCERLRQRIQKTVVETGQHRISVTASFGICMLDPGAEVASCIEGADRALYNSKHSGRNCVAMAEQAEAPLLTAANDPGAAPSQSAMLTEGTGDSDAFLAASNL